MKFGHQSFCTGGFFVCDWLALTGRYDTQEGYMPEIAPSIRAMLRALAYQNSPTIYSFFLAFTIAAIGVLYGGGTKRTMILEEAL